MRGTQYEYKAVNRYLLILTCVLYRTRTLCCKQIVRSSTVDHVMMRRVKLRLCKESWTGRAWATDTCALSEKHMCISANVEGRPAWRRAN